jgi:hypothetical protein
MKERVEPLDTEIHQFDNLDEVNHFFAKINLLKLTQEEIDNLNSPTTIKVIKSIIKLSAKHSGSCL